MGKAIIALALFACAGCVTVPENKEEYTVCDDAANPDCGDSVDIEVIDGL